VLRTGRKNANLGGKLGPLGSRGDGGSNGGCFVTGVAELRVWGVGGWLGEKK
jgi:hypothetical protein